MESPVNIEEEICKGCGLCIFYCPKEVIELSEESNQKGYNVAKVVYSENCIQCKQCEINCPDFAIYVEANGKRE